MKRACAPFLFICLLYYPSIQSKNPSNAVTYQFSGGRFGDNLLAFLHAKWVSYKYNIPLVFFPFKYSDHLCLFDENSLSEHHYYSFAKQERVCSLNNFTPQPDTLYIVPYFPESPIERAHAPIYEPFKDFIIDWNDPGFKSLLAKLIKPVHPIKLLELPKDRLTLAVHIRSRWNGWDYHRYNKLKIFANHTYLAKFQEEDFYIAQIKKLSEFLGNPFLYVFIFTDDLHPIPLTNRIRDGVNLPNLEFHSRANNATYLLDDFFSMAQFDFIIRSDSNYSLMVEKTIGTFKISISPAELVQENNKICVKPAFNINPNFIRQ